MANENVARAAAHIDSPADEAEYTNQLVVVRDGVVIDDLGDFEPGSRHEAEALRLETGCAAARWGSGSEVVAVDGRAEVGDSVTVDREGIAIVVS